MKKFRSTCRTAGILFAAIALTLALPSAFTGDKASGSKAAKKTAKAKPAAQRERPVDMEPMIVTGHMAPLQPQRKLVTTSPVSVIDSKMIRNSGARDLAALLNQRIAR